MESTRLVAKVQAVSSCERAINQRALTITQRDTKYKCFFAQCRANVRWVVATRQQPRLKIEPQRCYDEGSAWGMPR